MMAFFFAALAESMISRGENGRQGEQK